MKSESVFIFKTAACYVLLHLITARAGVCMCVRECDPCKLVASTHWPQVGKCVPAANNSRRQNWNARECLMWGPKCGGSYYVQAGVSWYFSPFSLKIFQNSHWLFSETPSKCVCVCGWLSLFSVYYCILTVLWLTKRGAMPQNFITIKAAHYVRMYVHMYVRACTYIFRSISSLLNASRVTIFI